VARAAALCRYSECVVDLGDISDIETRAHASATSHEPTPPLPRPPEPGQSLGRYFVIEPIGDGGMGRVLRAYDPKLEREVALKLLHPNVLDADAQARLVREARAMAMLSHPNVVAVYDVDDTPWGVMLVMELVRGRTLGAWVRGGDHSWSSIVARFIEAGRGLAAAHAAGLLHRDFKPSNVLIPEPGAAKVTDFGLAKLDAAPDLEAGASKSSSGSRPSLDGVLTAAGEVVGTPRYMAPEQHRSKPLGPAVDQYAFCIALWEALAGKAPFDGKWSQLTARKHRGPPPWPTDVVVPAWVVAALRRGLAVEPDQRWPSMDALLAALAPTQRRRPWRLVVGATAILGLATAGGLAWARDRAARCSGARAQLAGAWDSARRSEVLAAIGRVEASYATRVAEQTVAALDRQAAGWTTMHTEACEATTVRGEQSTAVMDLRMACLQQAKLELGAVTAVLADADAEVVQRAHELTAGLRPLSRCADLEALQAGVEPPSPYEREGVDVVRALVAEAKVANVSGRYAAAQAQLDAAKARLAEIEYGPVHTEVALVEGANLQQLGKHEAAEAAFRRALELAARGKQLDAVQEASVQLMQVIGYDQQRIAEGLQHRELAVELAAGDARREATAATALANVLQRQGKYDEAEVEHRRALALRESTLGLDHLDVAITRNNLANVLQRQGRYDEAEVEHRRALALRERILGSDHPLVAMSRNNLSNVLRSQGRYAEAEAELRRALAVQEAALGPDHPDVGFTLSNLGNVLYTLGEHQPAEAELRRAVTVLEQALGPDHPNVGSARSNLGNALLALGKHEQAATEYRRALTLMEKALGPDHPNTAVLRGNYAEALYGLGKHDEAEVEHRRALTRLEEALGPDHPELAKSRVFLAGTLEAQGKHQEAEAELRRAMTVLGEALGSDHPDLAMAQDRLAALLLDQDRPAEALVLAERAWSRRERDDTPMAEQAEAAFVLARALYEADPHQLPRARTLAQRAADAWLAAGDAYADDAERARAWLREHEGA
jgi:tetratricopeptide (TPR) repeat protein